MKKLFLFTLTALFLLGGCGNNKSAVSDSAVMKSGSFFDGNVSGITYTCESGTIGALSEGRYYCPENDTLVTFTVGDQVLGTIANGLDITPQLLTDQNKSAAVDLTRKIIGSDRDRNLSNGIEVDPDVYGEKLAGEDEAIVFLEKYFGFAFESEDAVTSSSSAAAQTSSDESGSSEESGDAASSSEHTNSSSSAQIVPVAPPVSSVSSKSKSSSASKNSSAQSQSSVSSATMRSASKHIETEPENWYIRLIAEAPARKLTTTNAQLGEIDAADATQNSLKAMSPFGSSFVDIVFIDPAKLGSGVYKTLYYRHKNNSEKQWVFTVKTDDPNSDIIVSWRGLYVLQPYIDTEGRTRYVETLSKSNPLLKKMQVVDEVTGETLPVIVDGQMSAFIVNMDGKTERTFRWELLTSNSNASAPTAAPVQAKRSARRFLLQSSGFKKPEFDLDHPPVLKQMQ